MSGIKAAGTRNFSVAPGARNKISPQTATANAVAGNSFTAAKTAKKPAIANCPGHAEPSIRIRQAAYVATRTESAAVVWLLSVTLKVVKNVARANVATTKIR